MPRRTGPHFRDLPDAEARQFLVARNVGRIAYSLHDRVDIAPINYASDGHWIFGRTSQGTKLSMLLHNPWCAFEIDDVSGMFEWTSVVVKGTFALLDAEVGSPDVHHRAERLLGELVPGTFSVEDPVPHRNIVFGIYIRELSGRASTP